MTLVEQTKVGRLATARLRRRAVRQASVIIDLLFASSGVEAEIVAEATLLEVVPGLFLKVARTGHLLAMKISARDDRTRPQDFDDIRALLRVASAQERALTKATLTLITKRGFARERDLLALWKRALETFG